MLIMNYKKRVMSKERRDLVFDVETTGLPEKGAKWDVDPQRFPKVVQFSWWFEGVFFDHIIKPNGYFIPKEATAIHGVTQEDAEKNGIPFELVVADFIECANLADNVIGHNIYFDSSVIKANVALFKNPKLSEELNEGLHKDKRICTMRASAKYVEAKYKNGRKGNKWPTLQELYAKLFNGKTFKAHNSLEDVKATVESYYKLIELGIIKIKEDE